MPDTPEKVAHMSRVQNVMTFAMVLLIGGFIVMAVALGATMKTSDANHDLLVQNHQLMLEVQKAVHSHDAVMKKCRP